MRRKFAALSAVPALPSNCEVVNGSKCTHRGSEWYRKSFSGNQVAYVTVPDPH